MEEHEKIHPFDRMFFPQKRQEPPGTGQEEADEEINGGLFDLSFFRNVNMEALLDQADKVVGIFEEFKPLFRKITPVFEKWLSHFEKED
ncbi:hypothetical protein [Heyndrickxia coagulans]|uniref:hypothetical protein n=1 Tax=Heyndrickxia coagulans TaxID=1398 RepID=UPI0004173334|nr:hypothetical protein [Heyndrickxia coagulans]